MAESLYQSHLTTMPVETDKASRGGTCLKFILSEFQARFYMAAFRGLDAFLRTGRRTAGSNIF